MYFTSAKYRWNRDAFNFVVLVFGVTLILFGWGWWANTAHSGREQLLQDYL